MRKIGFLAFLGYNYGSVLQSYALNESVVRLGYECEVIDCGFDNMYLKTPEPPEPALKNNNAALYNKLLLESNFQAFIARHFKFNAAMGSIEDNAVLNAAQSAEMAAYDAFLCGSDQIWKPEFFWFCAKRYLQFAPAEKRVAYAPSVGWKEIPAYVSMLLPQWRDWIASVGYISAREICSAKFIAKFTGKDVPAVLDPTLLLRPNDWDSVTGEIMYPAGITRTLASGKPYLLAYLLDSLNEKHLQCVQAIAEKLGLEIIWLTGRDTSSNVSDNCAGTDPAGFVNLIRSASFVCTDGFHGACFSLNFSRPFVVFKKYDADNDARIEDVLQRADCLDRYVDADNATSMACVNMNYALVQSRLEAGRAESLVWLKNALERAVQGEGDICPQATHEGVNLSANGNTVSQDAFGHLRNEKKFLAYLGQLAVMRGQLVIIAVRDTLSPSPERSNIPADAYAALRNLGLTNLGRGAREEFWAGYIAVIYKNLVIYEQLAPSGNSIFDEMEVAGVNVKVASSPYEAFDVASIKINGQECAINQRGLNIVVFDLASGALADSVAFDTYLSHIPAHRETKTKTFADHLDMLASLKDHLTIISAKDTIGPAPDRANITQAAYEALGRLGIQFLGKGTEKEFWAGYVAIVKNGKTIYERLGARNEKIDCEQAVCGLPVKVSSAPYTNGNRASIVIKGREYALNVRGLNIVSWDLANDTLADTVAWDTWQENVPAFRDTRGESFFNDLPASEFYKRYYLPSYLDKLAERNDCLVVLAVRDTMFPPLPLENGLFLEPSLAALRRLGLRAFDWDSSRELWTGYVAVIYRGRPVFEEAGGVGETVRFHGDFEGLAIEAASSPYITENMASIKVNGVDLAVNQRGLNIVVYDLRESRLLDSVAFDTYADNIPLQRNCIVKRKVHNGEIAIEFTNPSIEFNDKLKRFYADATFYKVKTIAALLRDYNIYHIVLSSGTRHAPLVRIFEYNQDIFTIHSVVDERSAGYFAIGLAAQIQEPVACVCTSGTAASNYLPPVTEAYFTGIPLIMITTDRLAFLLEHGEDQTIPQKSIFNGVIKKSVTLPEGDAEHDRYQARIDVSGCILECTHHVKGPVHINLAIDNPWVGRDISSQYWRLELVEPHEIQPHIELVETDNDHQGLHKCQEELRRSNRILLLYGQNPQPTVRQLAHIVEFTEKYNCLILTYPISNLHVPRALQPFNMLEQMSQKEYEETLFPDILITMGGKRLTNDPLIVKMRRSRKDFRHWDINPDGRIKDVTFKLSKVLECSQDYFFAWFAKHAGDIKNNDQYFHLWKDASDRYCPFTSDKFDSHYIQGRFLPAIPPNSILHLANSLSFYCARRYPIDPSVYVYCNRGTNGIDGSTSSFMGACAGADNRLCFLIVGDLSFFYDMNSIWNKRLRSNIRILLVNNNGTDLLRYLNLKYITCAHGTKAKGWAESVGFKYMGAASKEEFISLLPEFVAANSDAPLFFEVFC